MAKNFKRAFVRGVRILRGNFCNNDHKVETIYSYLELVIFSRAG